MNALLTFADNDQGLRTRMLLLLGQSFTFGILVALVVIIGNTLFLSDYGSSFLPYVYFAVALLGTLVSYAMARAQSVWTLPTVALMTMAAFALFFIATWFARTYSQSPWVSFALISAYPLVLRMSFMILGWQARRLLDVRQIKQLFPHVVTGFVVGFIAGGLIMPFFINLAQTIDNVILVMALASFIIVMLIVQVGRQFSDAFQMAPQQSRNQTKQSSKSSLWQLFRKPFFRWIFLYQLLMAMVSKFTDYLLLAQTEMRYDTAVETAHFFSNFYSILNIADLFFLLVIAAFFLRRFGLKAGLLANPVFLAVNFALMMVVGAIFGINSTAFFVLIILSRIMIVTLTDATTRTSVNATYQALPAQESNLTQTAAEGIAPQLALGVVGLVLLLFNAFPSLTFVHVALFTFLLVLVWSFNSLAVYRHYATNLLRTVKRRALRDIELTLNDEVSLSAVNQLLQSNEVKDVQIALNLLETAEHHSLAGHLVALARHAQPDIQIEALQRIEQHKLQSALPVVWTLIADDGAPAVQGAALQTLCALIEADAVPQVVPYLAQTATAVKRGTLTGLLRYGGISGIMAAAPYLTEAQQDTSAADRRLAAQVIGSVQRQDFYEPLLTLLQDVDQSVRLAALDAAAQMRHPRLLPEIISNLHSAATRSAALTTLLAYGPAILPLVATALNGQTGHSVDDIKRLVRLCGQIGGAETIALLRQHLRHPNSDIQEQIIVALNACGFQAKKADRDAIYESVQQQVGYTATLFAMQRDIGTDDAVSNLQRALLDEVRRVRRRLFYLLSFLYDSRAMMRVDKQLTKGSKSAQALAMEMLDITLSKADKALLFPLLEPDLTVVERLQQLPSSIIKPLRQNREAWLAEIIGNSSGLWRERWWQVCAIYAAGKLDLTLPREIQAVIAEAAKSSDTVLQETAVWALHSVTPETSITGTEAAQATNLQPAP